MLDSGWESPPFEKFIFYLCPVTNSRDSLKVLHRFTGSRRGLNRAETLWIGECG